MLSRICDIYAICDLSVAAHMLKNFITHYYNVKDFLIAIVDYYKFVLIIRMNTLLIKEKNNINHCNEFTFSNQLNDI